MSEPNPVPQTREVILIGTEPTKASDDADKLLDSLIMALQDFTTVELKAIADYRDSVYPEGWMPKMIREYLDVWRQ